MFTYYRCNGGYYVYDYYVCFAYNALYIQKKIMKYKKWYQSKTIQAALVLFLAVVYQTTGVAIEGGEVDTIVLSIVEIVWVVGVIYGRYQASHPIKK